MSWCTIESDPGVFTELIAEIGVKGVQVEEVYDMEDATFTNLNPLHGMIFLFKWQKEANGSEVVLDQGAPGVFFAKQVIDNACATQAIVSVLMNRPSIELGPELTTFKSFAQDLPPDMRGLAIGNSAQIRNAHNSFARPEPFAFESKQATEEDDVYHFIGYVPVNGKVYELDGLKEGPVLLGECDMDKWHEVARPAIQARMGRYSAKEIRFTLLALTQDRLQANEKRVSQIASKRLAIQARLEGKEGMDTTDLDDTLPEDMEDLLELLEGLDDKEEEAKRDLQQEKAKRAAWKVENVRRKHNYIPFIFNLLKELAGADKLKGLVEAGKKAGAERAERVKASAAKAKA